MSGNGSEFYIETAKSYFQAGEKLIYSVKANTFLSGGELYDEEHDYRGRIDCSTYISLVLLGIPYEKSPYVTEWSGEYSDLLKSAAPWDPEMLKIRNDRRPLHLAYELAQYCWIHGKCRQDDQWMPGDLLFFQIGERMRAAYYEYGVFKAISHVGIIAEDRDYFYESTGNQTVRLEENVWNPGVRKTRIADKRKPFMYARI